MSNIQVVGKNSKGEEVTCYVRRPNSKDSKEAKLYSNTSVAKAIKAGTFLTRGQAREQLKSSGIWGDAQEAKLKDLTDKINTLCAIIETGKKDGKQLKKSEGRAIALDIISLRNDQLELLTKVNELDEYTIEAQAENDEFDYLLSACLLDEEGNRLFSSVDEYKEKATDEPYYFTAAQELQNIIYGFRKAEDIAKDRIEYKFLSQCKFINDKLQFVDKDGNLTDRDGRPVDEEGYYLDDKKERVAKEQKVGEFLDD